MIWATRPAKALSSLSVAQLSLFGNQLLAVHLCWKPPCPQEQPWNHNTAVLYREPVSQLACSALLRFSHPICCHLGFVSLSSSLVPPPRMLTVEDREPAIHYNLLFRNQNLRLGHLQWCSGLQQPLSSYKFFVLVAKAQEQSFYGWLLRT